MPIRFMRQIGPSTEHQKSQLKNPVGSRYTLSEGPYGAKKLTAIS